MTFSVTGRRKLLVAVVGPDGKYCYEATGGAGGAILVSDGKTHIGITTHWRVPIRKPPPQVTTGEKTDFSIARKFRFGTLNVSSPIL